MELSLSVGAVADAERWPWNTVVVTRWLISFVLTGKNAKKHVGRCQEQGFCVNCWDQQLSSAVLMLKGAARCWLTATKQMLMIS